MTPGVMERIASKIEIASNGCWNWIGCLNRENYGRFYFEGIVFLAHRFIYDACNPEPLGDRQAHHICDNPSCVNPSHIEPLSALEHMLVTIKSPSRVNRLKTHCIHGHKFGPDNTRNHIDRGRNHRICKKCNRQAARRYYQRRKSVGLFMSS